MCGTDTVPATSVPTQGRGGIVEEGRLGRGVTGSERGDLGAWAGGSQVQALWAQAASPLKWSLAQRPVWFEMRATGPGLPRALAARDG